MKLITKKLKRFYTSQTEKSVVLSRLTGVLGIDILVKASGFILIPFYLQLMTQNEFGLYNYILSIIQTFSLILNFGLYVSISKYFHAHPENADRGRLLFTIFTSLSALVTVLLLPIYLFRLDYKIVELIFTTNFDYGQYRLVILLALIVTTLSFTLNSYFFTSEKIKHIKAYNFSRILFINILSIIALYFLRGDAVDVRLSYTYAGELLLLLIFSTSLIREMVPVFKRKLMLSSLKLGFPLMLSSIFGIIVNFGDKFFLERYGTLANLSDYYLAISFASIIPLIFASFQNIWLPLFMKEKDVNINYQKTKSIIIKLTLAFTALSILIWIGFQGLLWLGIIPWKYNMVTAILPLVLLTQIVASIVPVLGNYFIYFERTQIVSVAGFFVSIATLLFAQLLIPVYKTYGAALTSLLSNSLYLLIYYFMVMRIKKKNINAAYSV